VEKLPFYRTIRFYNILFSVIIGLVFCIQILNIFFRGPLFIFIVANFFGLLLVSTNLIFVYRRLNKELAFLRKSIKLVIANNFSRKFKLHKFPVNDEIGQISYEVSIMLDKVHERTTEVLLRRKELNETGKNIEKLSGIGRDILSKLEVGQIIRATFDNVSQLLDASLLAIGIYNKSKNGLDFYGIRAENMHIMRGFEDMKDPNRWSVFCYNSQEEILCDHFDPNCGKYFSALLFNEPMETRQSFVYLPLINQGKKVGVFTVQSFQAHSYTGYHVGILKNVANYIAIAILNAEAYKQIELQKEEIEIASQKLKDSYNELEEKVASRTEELFLRNKEIEKQNIVLERLSLVARKTDNAIMIMDSIGNIQWLNDCFTRIYNYTYEDFIKARGSNILQTSFNPNIKNTLNECISTKKSVYYEALNITGDGNDIWTQTTLTPVLNSSNEITHLLTIDSDITQRKEYELKITKQSQDITNSILYAKHIQTAVLPPQKWFSQYLKDFFVLYKPKDIVSGDFYWIDRIDDKILVVLADCTGHGVPGAFMSMLGISLLNEIARSNSWESASKMLDILRDNLIKSLRQDHNKYDSADGMDISLCIFDKKNQKLQFSGANSSLFIIRDNEIIELKGDKMPIGVYVNDNNAFNCNEIEISFEDKFYMSTDGYFDQFGGENNKKFMVRQFKQLLLAIQNETFANQRKKLDDTIKNWQGKNNVQIDDICVVGFKV
jgi:PAS domain S-box-containing protein